MAFRFNRGFKEKSYCRIEKYEYIKSERKDNIMNEMPRTSDTSFVPFGIFIALLGLTSLLIGLNLEDK